MLNLQWKIFRLVDELEDVFCPLICGFRAVHTLSDRSEELPCLVRLQKSPPDRSYCKKNISQDVIVGPEAEACPLIN